MKKTISCTHICISFLNFAGAKTATHIGRINGTLHNEGAAGEILRKVLLYPGKNASHVKVRAAHLIQLSFLLPEKTDFVTQSLCLTSNLRGP